MPDVGVIHSNVSKEYDYRRIFLGSKLPGTEGLTEGEDQKLLEVCAGGNFWDAHPNTPVLTYISPKSDLTGHIAPIAWLFRRVET